MYELLLFISYVLCIIWWNGSIIFFPFCLTNKQNSCQKVEGGVHFSRLLTKKDSKIKKTLPKWQKNISFYYGQKIFYKVKKNCLTTTLFLKPLS